MSTGTSAFLLFDMAIFPGIPQSIIASFSPFDKAVEML
jgi:hypothetical protein